VCRVGCVCWVVANADAHCARARSLRIMFATADISLVRRYVQRQVRVTDVCAVCAQCLRMRMLCMPCVVCDCPDAQMVKILHGRVSLRDFIFAKEVCTIVMLYFWKIAYQLMFFFCTTNLA
jgi:hypothetical protein